MRPQDHDECVQLLRDAFWNVYRPGCHEHLLWHLASKGHPDLVAELTLVAERDAHIIGCVMTTVAQVVDQRGGVTPVLQLGPLGVLPSEQGSGVGSRLPAASLIEESLVLA